MEALMGGELYSTYQKHTFYGDKATEAKKLVSIIHQLCL